ncbi:MAG: nitroreductase family protein [Lachnospiraceae bacterium]
MLMDLIKARHSIRKYTNEQISREDLETILEAGNYAPNAGGGQRSMMVAIHNKELAAHVGKMNMANFDRTHLAGRLYVPVFCNPWLHRRRAAAQ